MIKKGVTPYIDSYSAFFDNNKLQHTELEELIKKKEITDIYVCGIAYDVCVGEFGTDSNMEIFCLICQHEISYDDLGEYKI